MWALQAVYTNVLPFSHLKYAKRCAIIVTCVAGARKGKGLKWVGRGRDVQAPFPLSRAYSPSPLSGACHAGYDYCSNYIQVLARVTKIEEKLPLAAEKKRKPVSAEVQQRIKVLFYLRERANIWLEFSV